MLPRDCKDSLKRFEVRAALCSFSVSKWNRMQHWKGWAQYQLLILFLKSAQLKQFEGGRVYLGSLSQGIQLIFLGKAFGEQEATNRVAPTVYKQRARNSGTWLAFSFPPQVIQSRTPARGMFTTHAQGSSSPVHSKPL